MAASICTRGGKAVLSRQFRDLHKDRVAVLLANFPKLTHSGTQHTTVEDGNVRYVYQPLEELYVVLITNKQSNILQDIETLRLLAQVVSSIARNVDEREVLNNAFEILSAFDEVVTQGYRENLTLSQVKTFMEMESHEEKIQQIIERNKELEAAEERKRKAKQLEMQRRDAARRGAMGPGPGGMGMGMGGGGPGGFPGQSTPSYTPPPVATPTPQETVNAYEEARPKIGGGGPRGKGLQLGKKRAETTPETTSLLSAPQAAPIQQQQLQPSAAQAAQAAAAARFPQKPDTPESTNEGIEITIQEHLAVRMGRDGTVQSADVKGSLMLRIGNPDMTRIKIFTSAGGPPQQYKTHPKVDRGAYTANKVIGSTDASRPFPSNNQQLGLLRWKLSAPHGSNDTKYVPVTFNCWFSRSDPGFYDVTIEYEVDPSFSDPITDLQLYIPLVTANAHVADPTQVWDQFDDHLEWTVPEIQPGGDKMSGSFEFTAEADSEDDFFPMQVRFRVDDALSTFGDVDVLDVVAASDESKSLPFEKKANIVTESYVIE